MYMYSSIWQFSYEHPSINQTPFESRTKLPACVLVRLLLQPSSPAAVCSLRQPSLGRSSSCIASFLCCSKYGVAAFYMPRPSHSSFLCPSTLTNFSTFLDHLTVCKAIPQKNFPKPTFRMSLDLVHLRLFLSLKSKLLINEFPPFFSFSF